MIARNSKVKIGLLSVILAALAVSLLVSIGAYAEKNLEGVTLRALLIGNPDQVKWWNHIIPMFEEETGAKVEFDTSPFADLYTKQAVLAAAHSPLYDVYSSHFAKISSFKDYYMPLDKYLDAAYLEDVLPNAINPLRRADGAIVALPLWMDARLLYYNKEQFKEAGVEFPPKTWEELVRVAEKLTTADHYGLSLVGSGDPALRQYSDFLWQAGGQFLSDDYSEPLFNSDAGVKALRFYSDLIHKDKVVPLDAVGFTWPENTKLFSQGNASMVFDWPGMASVYQEALGGEGTVGFAPLPCDATCESTAVAHAIAVNPDSKNAEAAAELAIFLASSKAQMEGYEFQQRLPITKSVWDTILANAAGSGKDRLLALKQAADNGKAWPKISQWADIALVLQSAIEKALAMQVSPKEALDNAANEVRSILKE